MPAATLAPRLLPIALALLALVFPDRAPAAQFRTIYAFCKQKTCKDGEAPALATLLFGPDGTLYGTTPAGGNGVGVFFGLAPRNGAPWHESGYFIFCRDIRPKKCSEGWFPAGGVIRDTQGNLYGATTTDNSANHAGLIYELVPPASGKEWTEKILYRFCSKRDCSDGRSPVARLTYAGAETGAPWDGVSPLFGVTGLGGLRPKATGVLFSLMPPAQQGGSWTETVLHSFCARLRTGCSGDGAIPSGNLLLAPDGGLYGVTLAGGAHGSGTIYRLRNQTYEILYSFCSAANCNDGAGPVGGVTMDANSNLVGTTRSGGSQGAGTIFRLTLKGGTPTLKVLHTFCTQANCADGASPIGQLVLDAQGRFYGTTYLGGGASAGTAFVLDGSQLTVLHTFCSEAHCADGARPAVGLTFDKSGNLFGTAHAGGALSGAGTVFEITP